MTKLEELKLKMKNEYEKYNKMYITLSNEKDMINGCLNRIAVSDNEEEVERLYNQLISHSITEYKNIARECHNQFSIYEKVLDEYREEKNKYEKISSNHSR